MAEEGDEEGQATHSAGDDTSTTSAAAAALPSATTHALDPAPEATLAASSSNLGIHCTKQWSMVH